MDRPVRSQAEEYPALSSRVKTLRPLRGTLGVVLTRLALARSGDTGRHR